MLASAAVIRDVVIHLFNEQPLVADLSGVPSPSDFTLVCTNLRTMNRQRPIFVDHSESTFVFPYSQIRFIEIPGEAASRPAETRAVAAVSDRPEEPEEPDEIELDEELLRRVREL
jgi:hypothetical protein